MLVFKKSERCIAISRDYVQNHRRFGFKKDSCLPQTRAVLLASRRQMRQPSLCYGEQLLSFIKIAGKLLRKLAILSGFLAVFNNGKSDHKDLSLSSDLTHVSSSFPASPLSPSLTPSHFHSRLKTHLYHKSFPP